MRKLLPRFWTLCVFACLGFSFSQLQAQVTANFVASSVHICQGDTIDFTNLSTGAVINSWFENGQPFSATASPSRPFPNPGTFLITLIASDGVQLDTASTVILVNPSLGSTLVGTDASCNGFSDGGIDLAPIGGTPNLSLCFDGVDDYVNADSVTRSNFTGGITVEGWIKPNTVWNANDGMVVAFNTATGANHFLISYNRNQQRFLYFDDVVGNQPQSGISPLGQWAHLAITINGSGQGRMYVNGNQVRQWSTGTSWIPNGGRCSIGQEYDGFGTSQHFNGCMDEVRIWNTALTQTTIQSNYNNSCASIPTNHPNINSLIAYYSFNEGSGTVIFDRSGNDNLGDFNGTVWGPPIGNNYGCFLPGTGFAYNWSNAATTEDLTGLTAGTYAVTITDGAGCVTSDSIVVGEPAALAYTVTSSPGDTLCAGDTTTITATGGYIFNYSPGAGLSDSTGASVDAFPMNTTQYTVVATDTNGCQDTTDFTLVVNQLPTPAISGTDTLCAGDSTQLTATGGGDYLWNTADTAAMISVMPGMDSTFTVQVTDNNGCSASADVLVVVNALPMVGFSGNSEFCVGDSTLLTATGGATYLWSTGDPTPAIQVQPTVSTTYSVVVTDLNGCENSDSIEVVVNALPVVAIAGDSVICAGDTASLTASGGSDYVWDSGQLVAAIQVTPTVATTYSVMVTDTNQCENSDSFAVAVNTLPMVSIANSGLDTICGGDSLDLTASGAASYVWNTSAMTATISISPAASFTYVVTGTDGNGCDNAASLEIVVNAAPVISITGPDTICPGDSATLFANGGVSYSWDTGSNQDSIVVSPAATTVYSVMGVDANGCMGNGDWTVNLGTLPAVPVISQLGNTMDAGAGYATYQWSLNGSILAGETNQTINATTNGTYTVEVTNPTGCSAVSDGYAFVFVGVEDIAFLNRFEVFPNPNQGRFTVRLELAKSAAITFSLVNVMGQEVYAYDAGHIHGNFSHEINREQLAKGVYLLELNAGGQSSFHRVVVE